MSPRDSDSPKKVSGGPDVYTGLLFVSVAALITGCIFLVMELNKYDWTMAPGGP